VRHAPQSGRKRAPGGRPAIVTIARRLATLAFIGTSAAALGAAPAWAAAAPSGGGALQSGQVKPPPGSGGSAGSGSTVAQGAQRRALSVGPDAFRPLPPHTPIIKGISTARIHLLPSDPPVIRGHAARSSAGHAPDIIRPADPPPSVIRRGVPRPADPDPPIIRRSVPRPTARTQADGPPIVIGRDRGLALATADDPDAGGQLRAADDPDAGGQLRGAR
jgi:hypothetical protein